MDIVQHLKRIREKKENIENRREKHDSFIDEFFSNIGENVLVLSSGYTKQSKSSYDEDFDQKDDFSGYIKKGSEYA